MRKYATIAAFAFAVVPAAALGAQPTHPAHPATPASSHANANAGTKTPTVMFVLHGSLSGFTAANGSTNGTISITVASSNFKLGAKGSTLTFPVASTGKVVLHNGNAIADKDNGILKVRAPKGSSATTLQTKTAFQIIDQGPSA